MGTFEVDVREFKDFDKIYSTQVGIAVTKIMDSFSIDHNNDEVDTPQGAQLVIRHPTFLQHILLDFALAMHFRIPAQKATTFMSKQQQLTLV